MTNACFVDTNVLLYMNDPREPLKQAITRRWIAELGERDLIVISPQVMNEFANSVLRKFPLIGIRELNGFLLAMQPWCKTSLTAATPLEALAVHARYRYSFNDSALIAAALSYGCDLFLSEDLGSDQRVGSLTIINPFRVDPDAFLSKN